jgi:hypothetical protein
MRSVESIAGHERRAHEQETLILEESSLVAAAPKSRAMGLLSDGALQAFIYLV